MNYTISSLGPDDNQSLLDLARLSPTGSHLFYVDRAPDFFALASGWGSQLDFAPADQTLFRSSSGSFLGFFREGFERMRENRFTPPQAKEFALQIYHVVEHFPLFLSAIITNIPDYTMRMPLWRICLRSTVE